MVVQVITGRTVTSTRTFPVTGPGSIDDLHDDGAHATFRLRRENGSEFSDGANEFASLDRLLRSMSLDPTAVQYADVLADGNASDRLQPGAIVAPGNPQFEESMAPSFFPNGQTVGYLRPLRQGDGADFNVSSRALHAGYTSSAPGGAILAQVHVVGRQLTLTPQVTPKAPKVGEAARLTVDTGGPVPGARYDWDFGGGVHVRTASATHRFTAAGSVPVTVSVDGSDGSSGTKQFYVQVGPASTPTPTPTPSPGTGTAGGKHNPVHGPNSSGGTHEGASAGTTTGTGPVATTGPTATSSPSPASRQRGDRKPTPVSAADEVVGTLLLSSAETSAAPASSTTKDAAAAARRATVASGGPRWLLLPGALVGLLVLGGLAESSVGDRLRSRWRSAS